MADLTTTPNGIWILQALLGVEKMPTALRLRPFIPSVDGDGTVATELGDVPWSQTAEYNSLAAAGVIDEHGRVDDAVRDWMAVVGRPQREVLVVIRRPKPIDGPVPDGEDVPALIEERVMSICQRDRWLAMIARSGDEVVLAPLGEAARSDEQIDLICDTLLHAFSRGEAARDLRIQRAERDIRKHAQGERSQGPPRTCGGAGPPRLVTRPGRGALGGLSRWTNRRWRSSRSSTTTSRTTITPT